MHLHQTKKRKICHSNEQDLYCCLSPRLYHRERRRKRYQMVLQDGKSKLISLQQQFSQAHRTAFAIHHPMRDVAELLALIRRHFQPTMAEVLKIYVRQVCVHKSRMCTPPMASDQEISNPYPMPEPCLVRSLSSVPDRPELTWTCPECLFENNMLSPLFPQCQFGHNRVRCSRGNFHMWKCSCGLVRQHDVMQDLYDPHNPPRCWNDGCPGVISSEWLSVQREKIRRRKELMEVQDAQEKIALEVTQVLDSLRRE